MVKARTIYARLLLLSLLLHPISSSAQRREIPPKAATITITITPGHPASRFAPSHALGGAIDGHDKGVNDLQLNATNVQGMLSAGLKSLAYRMRTELAGDAWHWNPNGSWSDAANRQGYWTSDHKLAQPISLSYGYSLPRRGNTIDQADDVGYSRIDDGDLQTFWKSNPYLDRAFTGEDNTQHPQWVVVEFSKPQKINALRVLWAAPFPERYRVQYGNFDDVSDIALNVPGTWIDFPTHDFVGGAENRPHSKGHLIQVSRERVKARWLRIVMTESSGSSLAPSNDPRDHAGFALRELSAGWLDDEGRFHDRMHHSASRNNQTIVHVSSTDPWHRDSDLDAHVEQAGLDRIFQNGLTNGLPVFLPAALIYDTPENAANQIRYLRERGYKFDRVELGEEPDGQYITPEDFGELFLQWATAIHRVDSKLKLGGPSFQEILPDDEERAYKLGNSEWLRRFLDYLKRRGRTSDYSFFSFEWYPFDDVCAPVAPQLARAPGMLEASLHEMERRGLLKQIPWIISEYGYSAFASRAEINLEGALLNADIVGKFLTLGGDQLFLFGYTPGYMGQDHRCTTGNNMMFSMDVNGDIKDKFATYFGARLLTQEWLKPGDGTHEIYPASSDARDSDGNQLITAYAVRRPERRWSVLLVNKDPKRTFQANVIFRNTSTSASSQFEGTLDLYQYSRRQYLLGGPKNDPYPLKADPPEHQTINSTGQAILLPPYSLTVMRGNLSPNAP